MKFDPLNSENARMFITTADRSSRTSTKPRTLGVRTWPVAWAIVALVLALAPGRACLGQVDTPAARDARVAMRKLRQTMMFNPALAELAKTGRWEDVQRELQQGDRGDYRVVKEAADALAASKALESGDSLLKSLAAALETRAAELAPVPAERWPAECRAAAERFESISLDTLSAANQTFQERMDALNVVLASLGTEELSWRSFLLWPETRGLSVRPDLERELLDRLETRWENALSVWNAAELVEASLAVRAYVRLLRGYLAGESAEQHASAWNELAGLLEARTQTAAPDDARISTLVADRERMAQASRLTASVRRELSQPNLFVKVRSDWLRSQMTQHVDEPIQVNDVFAGAYTTGNGRLSGQTSCELLPASGAGQWILKFDGTTNALTTGASDGVVVQSHATTHVLSQMAFTFDARGLDWQPARTSANTMIQYDSIWPDGGPLRRRIATQQTWAMRGQAEADAAAAARNSFAARMNQDAADFSAKFNRFYRSSLRDPLILTDRATTSTRVRTGDATLEYESRIEPGAAFGTAAPPEFDASADALVGITTAALEEVAIANLAGRHFSGQELSKMLGGMLAGSSGDDGSNQDFGIAFGDRPCELSFADGRIGMRFHVTSFESGDVHYPAMTVDAQYKVDLSNDGPTLVRQGTLVVEPVAKKTGDGQTISGRQQTLQIAVRRRLNKVLTEKLPWPKLPVAEDENASTGLRTRSVLVDRGWLQMALVNDGNQQAVTESD